MAIMADGRAVIAAHTRAGRRMVAVDDTAFWEDFPGPRSSIRVCERRNVAFLMPREYQAWQHQRAQEGGLMDRTNDTAFLRLFAAVKKIAEGFYEPDELAQQQEYEGLALVEVLTMAYENMQAEARHALAFVREHERQRAQEERG